jgi:hypothetical protein
MGWWWLGLLGGCAGQVYHYFFKDADARRVRAFELASTTECTDAAIVDAITSATPKTRYAVGAGWQFLAPCACRSNSDAARPR